MISMKTRTILALITLNVLGFTRLCADPSWDLAKLGDKPYAFTGTATDGSAISLDALKGKVVLVYLFSTRPGAGMMELKLIEENMWPRFKAAGLVIVGVVRESEKPEVAGIAQAMHIDFPLVPDPKKEIFLHFATRGHPRAYLIGRDGTIKLTSLGYTDDELDRISAAIEWQLKR
jgi:peroxiredoxin